MSFPEDMQDILTSEEQHWRNAERNRIIKLLESLIDPRPTYQMPMEYWVQKKLLEYVIDKIKENN
jgi:hypothetical protein